MGRSKSSARARLSESAFALVLALFVLAQLACASDAESNRSAEKPFIEAGDLDEIRQKKKLRVLAPELDRNGYLPRRGGVLDADRELIARFARQEGLESVWIPVTSRSDLIPFLLEGKGDLIAANLTATPDRREHVLFTFPLQFVREQVVTRRRDVKIRTPADLEGRRVAVRRSSSFWNTLQRLRAVYPGIQIEEAPEDLDTDEIIHRVASRRFDVTVADSNLLEATMSYRDDLRVACDLTEDLPVAWAVRPGSKMLLRRLNRFLTEEQLARRLDEVRTGDLPEIRRQKVLRLLTRNSAATYFLWRGKLMGFEYELAREFARSQGLRLDVIVPQRGEDLLTMLIEGKGDLVAAALTPTEERRLRGVEFSRPYNFVSQVVVAPIAEVGLERLEDLASRTVYVRHSSAYWHTLSRLRADGVSMTLQAAPEYLETEEIIGLVADGTYTLTVADSHILDIELTWRA
ncbi:MAG: transporter substrate-binding domain-containing protein, partial [Planctomycetota bacterium]